MWDWFFICCDCLVGKIFIVTVVLYVLLIEIRCFFDHDGCQSELLLPLLPVLLGVLFAVIIVNLRCWKEGKNRNEEEMRGPFYRENYIGKLLMSVEKNSEEKIKKDQCFRGNMIERWMFPAAWKIKPIPVPQINDFSDEIGKFFKRGWTKEAEKRNTQEFPSSFPRLKAVYVINNRELMETYYDQFNQLKIAQTQGHEEIHGITNTYTTAELKFDKILRSYDLSFQHGHNDDEINEDYLFYATRFENIKDIVLHGFEAKSMSKCIHLAHCGNHAESSALSDSFTSLMMNLGSGSAMLCMIITRTLLGNICTKQCVDQNNVEMPCSNECCLNTKCREHPKQYNSIMCGSNERSETLIFNPKQCYPHIVVFYDSTANKISGMVADCPGDSFPCYVIGPENDMMADVMW